MTHGDGSDDRTSRDAGRMPHTTHGPDTTGASALDNAGSDTTRPDVGDRTPGAAEFEFDVTSPHATSSHATSPHATSPDAARADAARPAKARPDAAASGAAPSETTGVPASDDPTRSTPDAAADDLWVFGYGSLMWRPGFTHVERVLASVRGYHRALCVYSHVHRGTPERPGLVLGLDRGGACRGVAFRVPAAEADATIAYLRAREQVTSVYLERRLDARLADGRRVRAVSYVVDRKHLQYAGRLADEETLRIVRQGVGVSGENPDYVVSTFRHLVEIGVSDPHLARLADALAPDAAEETVASALVGVRRARRTRGKSDRGA